MALRAEELASFTLVDQGCGLFQGRGPVESMAKRLGHQGCGGGMLTALALMYVLENFLPFFRFDAALKYASYTASNQLVMV